MLYMTVNVLAALDASGDSETLEFKGAQGDVVELLE